MRFRLEERAAVSATEVYDRLIPARWPEWWPGARPATAWRVDVDIDGPRPIKVGLQVARRPDGVDIAMVEGDLSMLSVTVSVADGEGGAVVSGDIEIAFPVAVPAALHHDLRVWLGGRLRALGA